MSGHNDTGTCTGIVLLVREDVEALRKTVEQLARHSRDGMGFEFLGRSLDMMLASSSPSPYIEISVYDIPSPVPQVEIPDEDAEPSA